MAIEPIKGFYVHDEVTNTDGVAKVDYNNLANNPSFGENTGTYPIVMENGYYIDCATGTVDINNKVANTYGFSVAVVPCSEGDTFTINAQGGNTPRAWAMIDASGNIIKNAIANATVSNFVLTAEPNAAYIIINDKSNSVSYKGKYIATVVDKKFSAVSSTFELVELANEWEQGRISGAGYEYDSTFRVRTKKSGIAFGIPDGVVLKFADGFKYEIAFYDKRGNLVGLAKYNGDIWLYDYGEVQLVDIIKNSDLTNDGTSKELFTNMRIVVGRLDNADITPEDVAGSVSVVRYFPKLNKVYETIPKELIMTYPATIKSGVPIFGKIKTNGLCTLEYNQVCFTKSGTHYTNEFNLKPNTTFDGEYYFVLVPDIDGDCNLLWYLHNIAEQDGTMELWLSESAGVDLWYKNRSDNVVTVAASGYFGRYFNSVDYFCDGKNDEVEIQKAIDQICGWGYGTVRLLGSNFNIDSFTEYDNADRPTALFINGGTSINIEGTSSENSTTLLITQTALEQQEELGVQCDVFGINQRRQNTLVNNYKNLCVHVADQNHPLIVIDNYYSGASKLESVRLYALGYGAGKMPVEGLVGIRCSRGNPNGIGQEMRHVGATGFYEGFQMGGEHLVAIECLGRNCYYSYTFGNYEYDVGVMEHPLTLINCCDELSAALPLFNRNGKHGDYNNKGYQQVDLIGFNVESRPNENPTLQPLKLAEEVVPDSFCGRLEFAVNLLSTSNENTPSFKFWKDGSGERFRTVNMVHKLGGTTAERNTYTPTYMQEYFDTTLNKKLIYNGTEWVDMNGNAV